jgi:type I restriction enzyme R subunit
LFVALWLQSGFGKDYRSVSHLLRVYADLANDMAGAGFSQAQAETIARDVRHYEQVRMEIKLASGDYIDLKKYEPAMRTLLDRYIAAEESETLSSFDDMTLVDLIVKKGEEAIKELPEKVKQNREATAETIENNVRRLIIDEMPTNPKYYQRMSELLSELVKRRKQEDIAYKEYLSQIVELTKQVRNPEQSAYYPAAVDTKGKQALYDNVGKDELKAIALHEAITHAREDGWRGHPQKERRIKIEIRKSLPQLSDDELKSLFEIIKNQHEY